MDSRLTDLDALCLEVRDPLSRSYIDEAVTAYRAGSYKAAIVATYIAVTFDIIAKIRELADAGEAAAATFVSTLDANVASSNISKLLEIEGDLLVKAEATFQFIDPISRRHFERLKEDRNLCAHPAFTTDGPLFAPEPELVRLYIVEAIRNLLALRPVTGKTILSLFDSDFKGNAFPTAAGEVTEYVKARHLANSKPSVHVNLGVILLKAFLKEVPVGWSQNFGLIPAVLQAIHDASSEIWAARVRQQAVGLIEQSPDDMLANAFYLLERFPDLCASLSDIARTRLRALVERHEPTSGDVRPYMAVASPEFQSLAVTKFSAASREMKVRVITYLAHRAFFPTVCRILSEAGSYRSAETTFSNMVTHFVNVVGPSDLMLLLSAVASNRQAYEAVGIQFTLASFVEGVKRRHDLRPTDAADFAAAVEAKGVAANYAVVLELFGIATAQE